MEWFSSLFTVNVPKDLSLAFMDMFLLKGCNTLFYAGLALVSTIKKQVLTCKTVEKLQREILKGTRNHLFNNTKQIMLKTQKNHSISAQEILKFREYYQEQTMKEIHNAIVRAIEQDKSGKRRNKDSLKERKQQFLKEFPNFAVSRKGEKRIPLITCSHSDPKNFFTCNLNWQVCSFDFTFRKCICESIALRAAKFNVVDQHFYGGSEQSPDMKT